MRIVRGFRAVPAAAQGAVVAIGNFDGVHLGHGAVMAQARAVATRQGSTLAVLTFEPHPRRVLQPKLAPFRLTSFRTKARQFALMGTDWLVVQRFDASFAAKRAEEFVTEVLVEGLRAGHVVVGHDFVFGQRRAGTTDLLAKMAVPSGFEVTVVDAAGDAGEIFASRQIRTLLVDGRPQQAAAQLGRWWEVVGRVRRGESRGAALGFPTANLQLGDYLCPALGVYAVRVRLDLDDSRNWRAGVANLGRRPTFGGDGVVLEVHLLDHGGDLYGRRLTVEFTDYIRRERKFESVESLKLQIAEDCATARRILAEATCGEPQPATALKTAAKAAKQAASP